MENKNLCLERDAFRCRTCGNKENIKVVKLIDRIGEISNHLSNLISLCDRCADIRHDLNNLSDNNKLGVLLCGGKATRMYPLTRTINKHLLPIGIIPMAFHPISTLQKMGIKRVVIVMDQCSTMITETIGSGRAFGMSFNYKVQDGAFGIADALSLAKDVARPDDQIVCILGDNVFDNEKIDISFSTDFDQAYVYLKKVSDPKNYGIARLENNKILEIVEKPTEFVGDSAVVGLYIYPHDVFDVIEHIEPSSRGELEVTAINNFYIKNNRLNYRMVEGYWADCGGSIQRYAEASMYGAKKANVSEQEIDDFKAIVFDDK
ncbi:hypothetical protein LCGC14_1493740 [marine sediment metagenome]|uniref:glucose-1-phosphate thymidylyltransferase n=1 Tax=marine sediment metagenome TaxID=412755 RepID=A0A0F9M7K0_9ZZZZ